MHSCYHGTLARYVKLRVAHALGMPERFSLPPWISDPDMHHGTCVTDVLWCLPGSLTSGFLWSLWRRRRFRHSRRMHNPQFYVSGKRVILSIIHNKNTQTSQVKTFYSYHWSWHCWICMLWMELMILSARYIWNVNGVLMWHVYGACVCSICVANIFASWL